MRPKRQALKARHMRFTHHAPASSRAGVKPNWMRLPRKPVQFCRTMAAKRITKKDLLQIEQAAVRQARKEQGALDGRFREKVEKNKKTYTRKVKHKKKGK